MKSPGFVVPNRAGRSRPARTWKAPAWIPKRSPIICCTRLDGGCFGEYGKGYIRFSYANSMENLMEAVSRIKKASPHWEGSLVAKR